MKITKEFKIGLFVVTVLIMSFFLINYLRGKDIFNREIEIYSRYADVEGLVSSAPVYIKGYKAGKVAEVAYESGSGEFVVTCSILKEFTVPEDSRMVIYGVDIMGGKGIRIDLGNSSVPVSDGGFLVSGSEPALLDGLASSVTPIMEKVGTALDSLNIALAGVNKLLAQNNQESVAKILLHLEKTMTGIEKVASSIGGRSGELDSFISDMASFSQSLTEVMAKVDTTLTDASSILSAIDPEQLNGVVSSFHSLLDNVNDPDGSIGRLLTEDSVYLSVENLLNDIDSLIRKIEKNPKKYLRISVF